MQNNFGVKKVKANIVEIMAFWWSWEACQVSIVNTCEKLQVLAWKYTGYKTFTFGTDSCCFPSRETIQTKTTTFHVVRTYRTVNLCYVKQPNVACYHWN